MLILTADMLGKDVPSNHEIMWQDRHFKVVLFNNGEPVSYINLEDDEGDVESAVVAGRSLLNGRGVKF